jgi:hypothetical protein
VSLRNQNAILSLPQLYRTCTEPFDPIAMTRLLRCSPSSVPGR